MADDVVEIAPAGDVLLTVTQGDQIRRFRVNSAALRMTSKVFDAMLGPKFAEGEALADQIGAKSAEIKLEDDDSKCMEIILNFIHFRHYKVPERLQSHYVVDLAVLVDKYFLHEAVKLVLDRWLIPNELDYFPAFFQASIILQHAESFKETTRLMLLHDTTSYSREDCADYDANLLHFIFRIDNQRDIYRKKLMRALYGLAKDIAFSTSYPTAQKLAQRLLEGFHKFDCETQSLQNLGYLRAHEKAMLIFEKQVKAHEGYSPFEGHSTHPVILQQRRALEQEGGEIIKGLCLDCEGRIYKEETGGSCDFGHPDTS